ncbi:helix-turn-helix domain-containing protein [bacterium]|nr:helix-turn-helix domain-containing protein [bacterium]
MLRVSQVASRLNLSASKVYQLIDSGQLPHHRLGVSIRVSEEQLTAYLTETERRRSEPDPPRPKLPRPRLKHIKL